MPQHDPQPGSPERSPGAETQPDSDVSAAAKTGEALRSANQPILDNTRFISDRTFKRAAAEPGSDEAFVEDGRHYSTMSMFSQTLTNITREHALLTAKALGAGKSTLPDGEFVFVPKDRANPVTFIEPGEGATCVEDSQVSVVEVQIGDETWLAIPYPEMQQFGFIVQYPDGTALRAIPFYDKGPGDGPAYGNSWQVEFSSPLIESETLINHCFLSAHLTIEESVRGDAFSLAEGINFKNPEKCSWEKVPHQTSRKGRFLESLADGKVGRFLSVALSTLGTMRNIDSRASIVMLERQSAEASEAQAQLLASVPNTVPYSAARQALLVQHELEETQHYITAVQSERHQYLIDTGGRYMRDPESY